MQIEMEENRKLSAFFAEKVIILQIEIEDSLFLSELNA